MSLYALFRHIREQQSENIRCHSLSAILFRTIKQNAEELMEMRLSFRRQHVMFISIGVVVATGVMVIPQQLEWITGQHQQAVSVTAKEQEAVLPNVHEPLLPGDKETVLPNDRVSVPPPLAMAGAENDVACWSGGETNPLVICITDHYSCEALCSNGWHRGSPTAKCTVIF